MNKLAIPSILTATVLVAGFFAFMPVDKASSVHTTIIADASKGMDRTMFWQVEGAVGTYVLIPADAAGRTGTLRATVSQIDGGAGTCRIHDTSGDNLTAAAAAGTTAAADITIPTGTAPAGTESIDLRIAVATATCTVTIFVDSLTETTTP